MSPRPRSLRPWRRAIVPVERPRLAWPLAPSREPMAFSYGTMQMWGLPLLRALVWAIAFLSNPLSSLTVSASPSRTTSTLTSPPARIWTSPSMTGWSSLGILCAPDFPSSTPSSHDLRISSCMLVDTLTPTIEALELRCLAISPSSFDCACMLPLDFPWAKARAATALQPTVRRLRLPTLCTSRQIPPHDTPRLLRPLFSETKEQRRLGRDWLGSFVPGPSTFRSVRGQRASGGDSSGAGLRLAKRQPPLSAARLE